MTSFVGRRGVLYFSQFKPTEPYSLDDGIIIVPAGWQRVPIGPEGAMRMCRSYFLAPADWPHDIAMKRFRDWVAFDCFVMQNGFGPRFFDQNIFSLGEVSPAVECGIIGDADDQYKAVNYADVTAFLVDEFPKPDTLPAKSYADLYITFRSLSEATRAAVEWLMSAPPAPRRVDAFFDGFWAVLHISILIESLVGLPPTCECQPDPCHVCGAAARPHYKVPRRKWLRQELGRRIGNVDRVEEYAALIEAGKSVRDPMSHKPYFDLSSFPKAAPGTTESYGIDRVVNEFKKNSIALFALQDGLRSVVRALLVEHAFGIKHFRPIRELRATTIGGPS